MEKMKFYEKIVSDISAEHDLLPVYIFVPEINRYEHFHHSFGDLKELINLGFYNICDYNCGIACNISKELDRPGFFITDVCIQYERFISEKKFLEKDKFMAVCLRAKIDKYYKKNSFNS